MFDHYEEEQKVWSGGEERAPRGEAWEPSHYAMIPTWAAGRRVAVLVARGFPEIDVGEEELFPRVFPPLAEKSAAPEGCGGEREGRVRGRKGRGKRREERERLQTVICVM